MEEGMTKIDKASGNREFVEECNRGLAMVWVDFESSLAKVPIVARLLAGRFRAEDYRTLLLNLRQQVIEGGRWIARAGSSFGPEHEDLRSMFLRHAVEEHRDYRMLEDNFVLAGGDRQDIRNRRKNVGSAAFSGFMFHTASQPDPVGLMGAMFVIEGLGEKLAGDWSRMIIEQTGLPPEAVSFMAYHSDHDGDHLEAFDEALRIGIRSRQDAQDIVHCAKVVARLYRLQLEELDNV